MQVRSSAANTEEVIDDVKGQSLYNTIVSMAAGREAAMSDADDPILHPADTANATVFPGPSDQANLLSEYGKKVWLAGGQQTSAFEEARRAARSWRNDGAHDFWPLVQGPVFSYKHSDVDFDFPGSIAPGSQGLTLSFWYQGLEVNRSDEVLVNLYRSSCDFAIIVRWMCGFCHG